MKLSEEISKETVGEDEIEEVYDELMILHNDKLIGWKVRVEEMEENILAHIESYTAVEKLDQASEYQVWLDAKKIARSWE